MQVYYNPRDPSKSILEVEARSGTWLFFVIGAGCLVFGLGAGLLFIDPKLAGHKLPE